jgi:hypothetical protein
MSEFPRSSLYVVCPLRVFVTWARKALHAPGLFFMERTGIEPVTSGLQNRDGRRLGRSRRDKPPEMAGSRDLTGHCRTQSVARG